MASTTSAASTYFEKSPSGTRDAAAADAGADFAGIGTCAADKAGCGCCGFFCGSCCCFSIAAAVGAACSGGAGRFVASTLAMADGAATEELRAAMATGTTAGDAAPRAMLESSNGFNDVVAANEGKEEECNADAGGGGGGAGGRVGGAGRGCAEAATAATAAASAGETTEACGGTSSNGLVDCGGGGAGIACAGDAPSNGFVAATDAALGNAAAPAAGALAAAGGETAWMAAAWNEEEIQNTRGKWQACVSQR